MLPASKPASGVTSLGTTFSPGAAGLRHSRAPTASAYAFLLPDEMLEILSRDREHIHVFLECAQAYEALGEKFPCAFLEGLGFEMGHHFDDACAFAHVGPLVGPDEIGDVM